MIKEEWENIVHEGVMVNSLNEHNLYDQTLKVVKRQKADFPCSGKIKSKNSIASICVGDSSFSALCGRLHSHVAHFLKMTLWHGVRYLLINKIFNYPF